MAIRGRAKGSPGGGKGGWVASQAPALGPGDFFSGSEKSSKSGQPKNETLTLLRDDGSQRPSMLKKATVAPRGQATARDDPGRLPPRPCGAQALAPGPISPPISFEPPTR